MPVMVGRMDEGMSHLILLAVPLFVFLGQLLEATGMARAMVAFLAGLLGHVRGGLQYVLVGAMYLVSGISGAKAADMAAVAPALFPEMKARGADEGELVALLAATGAQTETVPPSLVLITIGSVTGVSIAALFTGGLLPALVLGLILCTVVGWRSRGENLSHVPRTPWRQNLKLFAIAFPALALPFLIRAAVVEGVATATEVSTIGIVYALIVGAAIYRQMKWRNLGKMLVGTAALSGAILLIIGTATAMAWGLTQSGFSGWLAAHDGQPAGRRADVPGGVHRRVRDPRLGARGHPGDGAVRPAAVPDRAPAGHPRRALRDGRHARDGPGPVRAAAGRGLLLGLRHRPRQPRPRHQADDALHAGAAGRHDRHRGGAVVVDRVPVS